MAFSFLISRMKIILLFTGLVFLTGCSSLYFYPQKNLIRVPTDVNVAYQDVRFKTVDGKQIHGWYLPALNQDSMPSSHTAKGTVFFLHGNSLNISYYLRSVYWLPEHGYNVFLFDYRGFGLSQGEAELPEIYNDIEAAHKWLQAEHIQQQPKPVFVLGQSIGGALGSYWIGKYQPDIAGFIIDSSFSSFNNMVQHVSNNVWLLWPFQYPIRWSFNSDFNPEIYAPQIKAPILQFHSPDDEVVPYFEGERLHESLRAPKKWVETYGAHINTFNIQSNRDELVKFLDQYSQSSSK